MDESGTMNFEIDMHTEFKKIGLLKLKLAPCSFDECKLNITFKYNCIVNRLSIVNNKIDDMYRVLSDKNPQLLKYV